MAEKFHTLNNFVILEFVDGEIISRGGIHIDNTKATKGAIPVKGKVVAVNLKNEQELEPGDELLFYRHAAEDIEIDGVKRLIISEKAMIGVYK